MTAGILVIYYSRFGATEALAREICAGIDSVEGAASILRTVPPVTAESGGSLPEVPDRGPPYATREDLAACDGLMLGSPTRFGNMAAPLKYFLDGTGSEWLAGTLSGKPAGVFTSTSTLHGGQETTLLSMALPLLHHGMLLVGIPFTESALSTTTTGGSPYGASHTTWNRDDDSLSEDEKTLASGHGARVAAIAIALSRGRNG